MGRLGTVAGVDGEERRALGIAHEENALGAERQRSGRLDVGIALLQARGRVARVGRDRRADQYDRRHGGKAAQVPQHPGILLWLRIMWKGASAPHELT